MPIFFFFPFFLILALPLFAAEITSKPNVISEFLLSAKERYEQILADPENSETIHFVMGNESADLDSVVSSIAYAYFLNQHHEELYLPLLNINRSEITLRRDVLYLFRLFDISTENLLFLDDPLVKLDTLYGEQRLRFNLVDHNILKPRQGHFSDVVERVIDHHVDERKCYPLLEDKLIGIVGSNATLVAEKILSNQAVFPELAALLLGPILIDTSNLMSVEKTTAEDIWAVENLMALAAPILPQNFYQKLITTKHDISGLTPEMLLIKDFKEYLDGDILYGISSLPFPVRWSAEDLKAIHPIIQKHAIDRDLTFFILLMYNNNPPIARRQIYVFSPSTDLLKRVDSYLRTDKVFKNLLTLDFFSEKLHLCSYLSQRPIERKQFQPLLHFSTDIELKIAYETFKNDVETCTN